MAVSKFNPVSSVIEALDAGQKLFGENRVQEAVEKFSAVQALHPDAEMHIIGSLQRNKVRHALKVCSCIQSADRMELLAETDKQARLCGKIVRVFFELHTGEDSKSGFTSEAELEQCVEAAGSMASVECAGFMTMAPFTGDERAIHAAFSLCRETAQKIRQKFPQLPLNELSMGMSGDYRIAIEEGSTLVRIGTAIFGTRS
jgi:pyridoxal phosphate enzyme (YggS family)